MDEEISIIDSKTRNEKIRNFFINNKKNLIIGLSFIIIGLLGFFFNNELEEKNKIKLANKFNLITINYKEGVKQNTVNELIDIIDHNDSTYSPLALYFLIDNELVKDQTKINNLFDVLINDTNLDFEIKNLIIYKKALYKSNFVEENELINILNPIINKENLWKSHALYLLGEYFFSKGENQKAKEFYNQILVLSNSNPDIKLKSQKRINRNLGE